MKIREISEQTSTDKPVKSKLGQMMAPTPVPKSLTQEPGKDSYARDLAGLLPGVGTAMDIKDIAGGDYSGVPYMALGLLPGGSLLKKGAKKLRKFLGKADDVADAAPQVTPPKAPDVTPSKAPEPRGEIDLKQEFKRIEAERVAKAEAEAAERAAEAAKKLDLEKAAEAERLKNIKLPGRRPLESDKGFLRRLEKMGPEYAAKHRQEVQTLKAMKDLKANSPLNIVKDLGVGALKMGGLGTGAALGYKYGPDVTDWALGKGIDTIQDIDTSNSNLPFPASSDTPVKPPDAAPGTSSNQNSTDTSDTPVKPPDNSDSDESPRSKKYGDQSRAPGKETSLTEKEQQYSKKQYIAWASKYAKLYDVPLPIVLHAMRKETGSYDADTAATIRGPKTKYGQAVGVMQLMPTFFKTLKPEDFNNPEKNIEAGTRFLAKLYNTYGDAEAALAAYNAGPNSKGFNNWLKSKNPQDLPAQTREYIYGNPKKKTIGFVDDVDQQVALLTPETTKDKVVRVATDVVSAASGSSNAQAANSSKVKTDNSPSAPQYPRAGTPIEQVARSGHYTNPILQPQDGRVHMQMQDLSSTFRTALDKALADYQKDNPGAKILVTSGARTIEDQKRLYAQAQAEKAKMIRGEPNNYRVASAELAGHAGYAIDMNTPDLVKLTRWLKKNDPKGTKYNLRSGLDFNDDVHLELRNWQELDQARQKFNQKLPRNKQIATAAEWEEYNQRIEQEKLALAQPKDRKQIDPLTGAPEARADSTQVDKKADKKDPLKFPSIQSNIPSSDYQSQGDDTAAKPAAKPAEVKPADKTPKAKTRTTTDALGRETTYTQNEKGQWVDPRGNIMPTPEKPGSRKDLSISDTGVEPSAADLEKTRKITGRSDPLIDPETGKPTTEKALRAKVEKQQRDRDASERSAGEQERKRVADLEKAQSDAAKSRADAEKPVDKLADKKAPVRIDKKDKQQRAPDAVAPAADVPAADTKAKTDVRKEFERAFATARAEKGPGETFTFTNPSTGKESTHTTNYRNEKTDKKSDSTKLDRKVDTTKSDSVVAAPEVIPADNTIIDKLTKKDSWDTAKNTSKIDVAPDTEVPVDGPALPEVPVFGKEILPNVWRDSSGKPVTSGTGDPIGTGTSEPDDIEAAKAELQQQADAAKAKAQLQAISPDLSQPEPSSWKNIWDKGIENITGKKRMSKDELNTIRVPESINNELADILRLAGRKK